MSEKDYVLGTHDEELIRLGLQHRVWRPMVLDCWQRAGITVGKRVLDLGAGPGYAALDLAEIVGPPAKSWRWNVPETLLMRCANPFAVAASAT
jgi:ubiquinone/menaquinone biosynthesis C-methylase UbiE